jgi:hypothetical protein
MTFDQGRDIAVLRPGQEIAFPMARHRPIFNRRRSLTDREEPQIAQDFLSNSLVATRMRCGAVSPIGSSFRAIEAYPLKVIALALSESEEDCAERGRLWVEHICRTRLPRIEFRFED